ncbi:MAG: hypothetical protein LC634_05050 [Sphingomonadales bacterium]|nr:hypothetical protein [Sphingomonadales bacterium]
MVGKATRRRHFTAGCGVAAIAAAILAPSGLHAQAAQGNFTVDSGAANANRTATIDDIFINSAEAVLTWSPFDMATGTNAIDFLPFGNTINFRSAGDFVVLNRIIANDPNRPIGFNGDVNSLVNGITGGTVMIYSPSGLVIGATGTFDVGNLVLTANDIDTTGGLFGPDGEIRFRGAANSTANILVRAGAQITAPMEGSYVAMVAPRITQQGDVRVNGSTGYVAAESADITINSGLFDINILTGTTVTTNAVNHTGSTGGPSSNGGADHHAIYFVAMPKFRPWPRRGHRPVRRSAGQRHHQRRAFLLAASGVRVE